MDLATRPVADDRVVAFERVFRAPPELVFALWSDPAHIVRWWGPETYALAHCQMDFREGGTWRFCLKQQATGFENWVRGTYRVIEAPRRLSFSYVNEDDGHETVVEMIFSAEGPDTRMQFRQERFADRGQRDAHDFGWNSTFDLFAEYLAQLDGPEPVGKPRSAGRAPDLVAARSQQELEALGLKSRQLGDLNAGWAPEEVLEIVRDFEAPAALLFRLWSEPEHLVRWLPEGLISVECAVDFREGGRWRQVFGTPDDPDRRHIIYGVYREIDAPHRLSMTYVNDYDRVETLVTLAFRELGDGRTEMTFRQVGFPNAAERDGHGGGWRSSFEVLAAYIAALDPDLVLPPPPQPPTGVERDIEAARKRQAEARKTKAGRD